MVFLIEPNCPYCKRAANLFYKRLDRAEGDIKKINMNSVRLDNYHDKDNWDKWHNGKRDNDWLNYKEYCKKLEKKETKK